MELLRRPRKSAAKCVLVAWAEQWSHEGVVVDREKPLPPKEFVVLPRAGGLWNALLSCSLITERLTKGLRGLEIPFWRPAVG